MLHLPELKELYPDIDRALSIRQPWAWAIINAGKDIENRTWATNYRGPVFIHASRKLDADAAYYTDPRFKLKGCPYPHLFSTGGIIGIVDIVDCVQKHISPWFDGPYGFVLANPRVVDYTPCPGRLSIFHV